MAIGRSGSSPIPPAPRPAAVAAPKAPRRRQPLSLSLRLLLTLAFMVLGIAPVVFFMVRFIPQTEQKIENDTREQHMQAAPPATTLIAQSFAQQEYDLRRLASVFAIYNDSSDRMQRVGDLLSRRVLDRWITPEMPYIAFFGEHGARFEARPQGDGGKGAQLSDEPEVRAALGKFEARAAANRAESAFVRARGQTWRVILMPIRNGEAQNGALVAIFDMRSLRAVLADQFQRGGMSFAVIDGKGGVLLRGGGIGDTVGEQIESDPLFTVFRGSGGTLPRDPLNKRVTRDAGGKPQHLVATFAPVDGGSLGFVIFSDERFLYSETRRMRAVAVVLGGLLALLAAGLGLGIAGFILRPIHALMDATRQIAAGDFSKRAPRSAFGELNALSGDFDHMRGEIEGLIGDLSKSAETNKNLFVGTVRAIANALDAKDPYTRGHSERVSRYAKLLAEEHGLGAAEVEKCEISALLHDIGKVGVEDAILRKPAALSEAEFEVMKQHPGRGSQILGAIAEMKDIIPGVRGHHERWSGGGYPDNLAGEKIQVQARIVSVADTLDAMTTERPYQKAMSMAVAAARINQLSGKSFDPKVVESFNRAYQKGALTIGAEKKLIIPKNRPQVA